LGPDIKKNIENTKQIEKMLEEKKIYQWEEYTRTPRKLPKTGWERSKYTKLKNLTAYFDWWRPYLQEKFNLKRKIQNGIFKDSMRFSLGLIEFY
jgi:hypothetical protein